MKLTNFKMYPLMIAAFALFAFSGCDGTTGISSDSGIAVVAPVPDAGTSTVTANLGSVLADGTSTSTVTVTVKDAASNPITDAAVSLAQTGSSTIGADTNNGDGTYMFDVTSTTVETVTYTATADTVAITQTVDVDFTETEAQCLFSAGGYEAIVLKDINGNNRTWLDRNLGASEWAANVNDPAAFGNYYQFGRGADGHEDNESATTTTQATTLNPNHSDFIVGFLDWTTADSSGNTRSTSWSTPKDEINNPNQVCPCGYIVPTEQNFIDLNITDSVTADTFKVAYAGFRWYDDGRMGSVDSLAYFWTNEDTTYELRNDTSGASGIEALGHSIRCIKP